MLKNKFFLHLDYSVAQEEYNREPHHDSNTRIINFLLYLNTLENNNGGALEIYNYKNNDNLTFKRAPSKENLELNKKISPKAGKLIVFLSSPKSIHAVEIFKPQKNEKRYFIYGGYTSFFDVNWKNTNIKKT